MPKEEAFTTSEPIVDEWGREIRNHIASPSDDNGQAFRHFQPRAPEPGYSNEYYNRLDAPMTLLCTSLTSGYDPVEVIGIQPIKSADVKNKTTTRGIIDGLVHLSKRLQTLCDLGRPPKSRGWSAVRYAAFLSLERKTAKLA
jgi:hypothetical protein